MGWDGSVIEETDKQICEDFQHMCLPPSDLMRQSVEEGGCASGSRTCWRKIVNI